MAIIWSCQYNVTNPDIYAKYNPGSLETIMGALTEAGGSLVAAGLAKHEAGDERQVSVILKFPDADAIQTWLDHPDYAEAKALREASTNNYNIFTVDAPG